jgi:hypothetical protein
MWRIMSCSVVVCCGVTLMTAGGRGALGEVGVEVGVMVVVVVVVVVAGAGGGGGGGCLWKGKEERGGGGGIGRTWVRPYPGPVGMPPGGPGGGGGGPMAKGGKVDWGGRGGMRWEKALRKGGRREGMTGGS